MTEFDLYREALKLIDSQLHTALSDQGHKLTGALETSIYGRVYSIPNGHELKGFSLYYGQILDQGVKPERVPFELTGRGGKSAYITGLFNFWKKRGLSDKEAKSAAFATAIKHKKEGISTQNSQKYSKTGFRKNFIDIAGKKIEPALDRILSTGFDNLMDKKFNSQKSETI